MSELKEHRFITTDELFHDANAGALYYDKSEADRDAYKKKVEELAGKYKELAKDHDKAIQACCDADKRISRLQHALWMTRANKAESEARGWYHSNAYIIKYDGLHNIKGVLYGKGFKRYPDEWIKLWIKIESLCLAKAKESDK